MAAEARGVDRTDAERSVREVEALDAIRVPDELRDDLPEAQRHDRQVVTTQPERRQADQDPPDGGEERGAKQDEPDRDVDPVLLSADPDRTEVEPHLLELA